MKQKEKFPVSNKEVSLLAFCGDQISCDDINAKMTTNQKPESDWGMRRISRLLMNVQPPPATYRELDCHHLKLVHYALGFDRRFGAYLASAKCGAYSILPSCCCLAQPRIQKPLSRPFS